MGGSAAENSTPPEAQLAVPVVERAAGGLRASDAERDEVAGQLRDEFVAGRLSHETFMHRMNAVLEAKRQGELPPLVADLPAQPLSAQPQGARSLTGWVRSVWARLAGAAAGAGGGAGRGAGGREHAAGQRPALPAGQRPALPAGQRPALPAGGRVRSMTSGMLATADIRRPVPLQFPRGRGEQFSIGRDAGCDLAIADMTVSRRHATLERTPEGWLLTDLGSTNGTRVNGCRVRGKVKVTPGDLVSFGNAEYALSAADAG